MIPSKFYAVGSSGEIVTTNDLSSITDSNFLSDFTDPYLMGYIPRDLVPACLAPIKLTAESGSLSLRPDPDVNIGWGYCTRNYRAYAGEIAVTDGSAVTRYCPVSSPQTYFINDIEMSRVVNQGQITVTYYAEFIKNDFYDTDIGTSGFVHGGTNAGSVLTSRFFTETYNITDFMDICKNGGVLIDRTLENTNSQSPIYGIQFPIRLTATDFPKPTNSDDLHGVFLDFTDTADCHIFVAIAGYNFAFPVYVNDGDSTTNLQLVPFSAFSDGSKKYMYVPPVEPTNQALRFKYDKNTGLFSNFSAVSDNTRPAFAYDSIDGYLLGGFNMGTLDKSDGLDDIAYPGHNYAIRRNFYIEWEGVSGSVVTLRLQSIYSLGDIYNFVSLWHKHAKTAADISNNYNSNIYTTVFTADDAYTGDYMYGDLAAISDRLRPWQFPSVPITANSFTPDDIPDADGIMDEETGDSIIRPDSIVVGSTAGFLTQYVLNAANVAELGAALWSGIGDANFWQNVLWTTLTASASFDVSSLLQYFISLRVYPFPLVNVSTYAGTGDNKIRIGRGAVPLTLGTSPNVGTISQYADILDAGTVQVPAYYGDFRDYAQTDIILHAPYIGTVNLAAADVIGATLHLVYAIDFAAGSCTAYLDISRGGFTYPVCLGSGTIGADVPLTADSASRRAAALFGLGDAALTNISQNASAERGAEGELDLEVNPYGMLAGAARGIMGANPIAPTMSGIGKGFDSFAGAQTAYIQIRRAITKNPGNQDKTYGRQTAKSARLGDLSGFTVCQNVDVSGLECDLETKNHIKRLLEAGIYI